MNDFPFTCINPSLKIMEGRRWGKESMALLLVDDGGGN